MVQFSTMALKHNLAAVSFILLAAVASESLLRDHTLEAGSPTPFSRPNLLSSPISFELKIRDAPTPTVDIGSMPSCAESYCFDPDYFVPLPCPIIDVPCPTNVGNYSNDATNPTTCSTYPLDCYCSLPTPIACAWEYCPLLDAMLAENWFAGPNVCPLAANVSFDDLPSCAQSCIMDNSFNSGCITQTRSCFCSLDWLFGCDTGCSQGGEPGGQIAQWYVSQCNVTIDVANAALNGPKPLAANKHSWETIGSKLHWYEIMALVVAAATLVTLVAMLLWLNSIQKKEKKKKENEMDEELEREWREKKKKGSNLMNEKHLSGLTEEISPISGEVEDLYGEYEE